MSDSGLRAPRILVTDAQERAVLACLRNIGQDGLDVTAVATSRVAPGLWSRAADQRFVVPDPRRSTGDYIACLEAILSQQRHDLMIAGTDASAFVLSAYRDRLTPLVRIALPSADVVDGALNRERLSQAASRAGLTFPESKICAGEEEAVLAGMQLGLPVLVKPLHTVIERDGAIQRWATVLARQPCDIAAAARDCGRSLVQRLVEGAVLSVAGVATRDGLLALVVSRAIRQWPADRGSNFTFSETISPPSGLVSRVEVFIKDLRWTGLFELEVIAGAFGELSAIDFNPRPYGSLALAVGAGVPLPAIWCRWLLGQHPKRHEPRLGARFRWEDGDLRHVIERMSNGRFRPGLQVLRPAPDVTHGYFQLRDPVPAAIRAIQIVVDQRRGRAEPHPPETAPTSV